MDQRKLSHDIQNLLERLRIMHDLINEKKYSVISKEEIEADLAEALQVLQLKFKELLRD